MKEKQITKASQMAGLIARTLCTHLTDEEAATLKTWTAEHPDNQLLLDELSDPDKLYQQLIHFKKFQAVTRLARLNQRLFDTAQSCTNCLTSSPNLT